MNPVDVRIRELVDARAERLFPIRLEEAIRPYRAEVEGLKLRLRLAEEEIEAWKAHVRRRYATEWERRRLRENGRKKYSPCVDCGRTSRGVRCKDCHDDLRRAA